MAEAPEPPFPVAIARDSYRAATEDRGSVRVSGNRVLIAVADGVGGMSGGAAAAELAVLRIMAHGLSPDPAALVSLLREADRRVYEEPDAGETTVVAAVVTPHEIAGASVGDSEAWLVTDRGRVDLTGNQRFVPTLGSAGAVPIPFVHRGPGGTLLVATDGLFGYAPAEKICAAARGEDLDAAARALVDLARLPNGTLQDDITVVLCRWRPSPDAAGGPGGE